jgi:hypothetical protein
MVPATADIATEPDLLFAVNVTVAVPLVVEDNVLDRSP